MARKTAKSGPENKRSKAPGRDEKGRILKGHSGNPGGRPKVYAEARAYAASNALRMLELLVALADDTDADPKLRRDCAKDVIEFGIGRAPQAIELTGNDDQPAELVLRWVPGYLRGPEQMPVATADAVEEPDA